MSNKNSRLIRVDKNDVFRLDNYYKCVPRTKAFSFMTQSLPQILDIKVIPKQRKRKKKLRVTFLQEFEV
jgi:uncharacterized PurR-regulated membrane protein YhhQ (DUF165 family)